MSYSYLFPDWNCSSYVFILTNRTTRSNCGYRWHLMSAGTWQLFREYVYQAEIRPKFGVSLGLLIDSLNTFTSSTGTTALELCYPGPDMQMILK
jgi:hypothetical protein